MYGIDKVYPNNIDLLPLATIFSTKLQYQRQTSVLKNIITTYQDKPKKQKRRTNHVLPICEARDKNEKR